MKLLVPIFLAAVLCCSAQDARPQPRNSDSILFRNGDMLYGDLSEITRTNGIKWGRGDAASEFFFTPSAVTELALGATQPPADLVASNLCTIQLPNGDQFNGVLAGFDGEKATVETSYAGTLQVPKSALALLIPLGLPKPVLFEGPTGIDGWTMGKVNAAALVDTGEWHYRNNAFYAAKSASIARDIALPDSASLQFELEWRGFFHVAIALYTEYLHPVNLANKETEPRFGGFYSLQINPFSANLLPVKQMEPLRYLGQAPMQTLAQKNAARFDIRVSKSKRMIALLIDGVVAKQWVDTDEFAGTGTAIRFVHQGQGAVKLKNIRLTEWDGQFDEPIMITQNKPQDLARLKNGDRIFGNVKTIKDGKLTIEAAATVLDVPLERVKQIEMAAAKAETNRTLNGSVRAHFANGTGSLTFDLEKWTDDQANGASTHLGPLTLNPKAFSKIVFGEPEVPAAPAR